MCSLGSSNACTGRINARMPPHVLEQYQELVPDYFNRKKMSATIASTIYKSTQGLFRPLAPLPAHDVDPANRAVALQSWGRYLRSGMTSSRFTSTTGGQAQGGIGYGDRVINLNLTTSVEGKNTPGFDQVVVPIVRADPLCRLTYMTMAPLIGATSATLQYDVVSKNARTVFIGADAADLNAVVGAISQVADAHMTYEGLYVRMMAAAFTFCSVGSGGMSPPNITEVNDAWPRGPGSPGDFSAMFGALSSTGLGNDGFVLLDAAKASFKLSASGARFLIMCQQAHVGGSAPVAGILPIGPQTISNALPVYVYGPPILRPTNIEAAELSWGGIREAFRWVAEVTGDDKGPIMGMSAMACCLRVVAPEVSCLGADLGDRYHEFPNALRAQLSVLDMVAEHIGKSEYSPMAVATFKAQLEAWGVLSVGSDLGSARMPPPNLLAWAAAPARFYMRAVIEGGVAAARKSLTGWEWSSLLAFLMANNQISQVFGTLPSATSLRLDYLGFSSKRINLDATLPCLGLDGVFEIKCCSGMRNLHNRLSSQTAAVIRSDAPRALYVIALTEREFVTRICALAAAHRAIADGVMMGAKQSRAVRDAASGGFMTGDAEFDQAFQDVVRPIYYEPSGLLTHIGAAITDVLQLPYFLDFSGAGQSPMVSNRASAPQFMMDIAFPPQVAQLLVSTKYTAGGFFETSSSMTKFVTRVAEGRRVLTGSLDDSVLAADILGIVELGLAEIGLTANFGVQMKINDDYTNNVALKTVPLEGMSGARVTDYTPLSFSALVPSIWWCGAPFLDEFTILSIDNSVMPYGSDTSSYGRSFTQGSLPPTYPGFVRSQFAGIQSQINRGPQKLVDLIKRADRLSVPATANMDIAIYVAMAKQSFISANPQRAARYYMPGLDILSNKVPAISGVVSDYKSLWKNEGSLPMATQRLMGESKPALLSSMRVGAGMGHVPLPPSPGISGAIAVAGGGSDREPDQARVAPIAVAAGEGGAAARVAIAPVESVFGL